MIKAILIEDEYLQIELLPVDNLSLIKETGQLSEKYRFETRNLKIKANELASILGKYSQECEVFYLDQISGSGLKKVESGLTKAFGPNSNTIIFFEIEDQIVSNIWLHLDKIVSPYTDIIESMVITLHERYNLILVDWNRQFYIDFNPKEEFKNRYFNADATSRN